MTVTHTTVDTVRNTVLVYMMRIIRFVEGSTYTAHHSDRVAGYSNLIAAEMGFRDREIDTLWRCALLHDIGKLGVSYDIIMARRSLTKREYEEIKRHSEYGYEILAGNYFSMEATIALQHHERFDGKGYPENMKGKGIHVFARIISVADVFDSLTDDRPYRKAWKMQDAADYINDMSGSMFDPEIVSVFFDLAKKNKFNDIQKIEGFSI